MRPGTNPTRAAANYKNSNRIKHKALAIQPILDSVTGDMQRVEGMIRESLKSDVVLIRKGDEHIWAGGGKRLSTARHAVQCDAARSKRAARL